MERVHTDAFGFEIDSTDEEIAEVVERINSRKEEEAAKVGPPVVKSWVEIEAEANPNYSRYYLPA